MVTDTSPQQGYDRKFFEDIRLIDVDPSGGATWEMDVTEYWSNLNAAERRDLTKYHDVGVMHGGAYAVIFDMCTAISMNPITKPGYWYFLQGVSRSLNLSYLKGIPTGTTIRIKCTTLQHGRTMAMLRGVIESVDGKIVYATAEHHKVATPAKPEFAERLMKEREKVALRRREKL
ncbi:conserved hypothetical protein [Microsporum canis CBS 113480]|uniref:Thioesterase domain-containing protein n=1 Tax=Arthroderma otae (strain ATCC MYA-4605 / CBS 113480) TaxID=554155 RepID=C5FEN8_ARTOC|nr:conserved hypothetical protein [Microsporum canis CBS 113480]EEQ28362.1 conserved hypothetical protein [Microsporum canis CBS 113480]